MHKLTSRNPSSLEMSPAFGTRAPVHLYTHTSILRCLLALHLPYFHYHRADIWDLDGSHEHECLDEDGVADVEDGFPQGDGRM